MVVGGGDGSSEVVTYYRLPIVTIGLSFIVFAVLRLVTDARRDGSSKRRRYTLKCIDRQNLDHTICTAVEDTEGSAKKNKVEHATDPSIEVAISCSPPKSRMLDVYFVLLGTIKIYSYNGEYSNSEKCGLSWNVATETRLFTYCINNARNKLLCKTIVIINIY